LIEHPVKRQTVHFIPGVSTFTNHLRYVFHHLVIMLSNCKLSSLLNDYGYYKKNSSLTFVPKSRTDRQLPTSHFLSFNVGKTRTNHPPVITIFMGGMVTIPSLGSFIIICHNYEPLTGHNYMTKWLWLSHLLIRNHRHFPITIS
jgi:hypothetical protein